MGAPKIIATYCNTLQIKQFVNRVTDHIHRFDLQDMPDMDEIVFNVRICVDFDDMPDKLRIKTAEVLDQDWDLLPEDSIIFSSMLQPIVDEYNCNHRQAIAQCRQIRKDEIEGLY